jgi:hypothetical protein
VASNDSSSFCLIRAIRALLSTPDSMTSSPKNPIRLVGTGSSDVVRFQRFDFVTDGAE